MQSATDRSSDHDVLVRIVFVKFRETSIEEVIFMVFVWPHLFSKRDCALEGYMKPLLSPMKEVLSTFLSTLLVPRIFVQFSIITVPPKPQFS